jgi:kynurenine formamidase
MANLQKLPPYGFTLVCFPVKVKAASAGWVRPVAIVKE